MALTRPAVIEPTLADASNPRHDADLHAWAMEQAALIRRLAPQGLDVENLAEEVEGVGAQQRSEIENRLCVLLVHLLKARYQPQKWKGGWQATSKAQRMAIMKSVRRNPSLRDHPAAVLQEEYDVARLEAAGETGLDETEFPLECPFSIQDVLDEGFFGIASENG